MTKKILTKSDLQQFTGSEIWFRHQLAKNVLYTQGVRYVAETGGAYWLIDEIAFAQAQADVKTACFQVWTLNVYEDRTATLTCDDGDGNKVFAKFLDYTDFPLDEIRFYYTTEVLLLPSEY